MTHNITIDEQYHAAGTFRARCLHLLGAGPRCGFVGPWHSAAEFENSHENASGDVTVDLDGTQAAFDAATADGDDHLAGLEFGPS